MMVAELNQIGAAYAYARGYDGTGITVSIMAESIDRGHDEFMGQLLDGYNAETDDSGTNAGTCMGMVRTVTACLDFKTTAIAGIIAARKNDLATDGRGKAGHCLWCKN